MAEILDVSTPAEVEAARILFGEYKQAVGVDLWFGSAFQRELEQLPEPYASGGRLVVAREGDEFAGCGGLRPVSGDTVELRRLWVRRPYRKRGLARELIESLLGWAREAGYRTVRLEVLSVMPQAFALFRSLGFEPLPEDRTSPFAGSVLLGRRL